MTKTPKDMESIFFPDDEIICSADDDEKCGLWPECECYEFEEEQVDDVVTRMRKNERQGTSDFIY